MSKHRAYCFTLNNYTDDHVLALKALPCRYIIFGKEKAPTTGTPHLQGYLYYENPVSFKAVAKLFPWCIYPAKGTADQNKVYCTKEDADFYERGVKPMSQEEKGQAQIDQWKNARAAALRGDFASIPDDLYIRYQGSFKRMRLEDGPSPVNLETKQKYGLWIWGPPRTGKSHKARTEYQPLYLKDINKWWDGYVPGQNVLIDEYEPSHSVFMVPFLKKWVDKWTFSAEVKGGRIMIRPQLIIVTSNYSIEQCFHGVDYDAIKSRFDEIHLTEKKI